MKLIQVLIPKKNLKKFLTIGLQPNINRSLQQAAEILSKMYPNEKTNKDFLFDVNNQIMDLKINFLEKHLKENNCKFV